MKIYLAAMFSQQLEIRVRAKELEDLGIEVTSHWLYEPDWDVKKQTWEKFLRDMAIIDVEDIRRCDVFVLFTQPDHIKTRRGGRHWETGFAWGIGKPVILVGPRENIFHRLPNIVHLPTWEEAKGYFAPLDPAPALELLCAKSTK